MTHVNARCAKAFGMAAVIAGGLGFASAANAAPIGVAPLAGEGLVQTVAGGCGPGFHPNPWGECRPHWGPRPHWRRPVGYGYGAYGYGPPPRPFYRPYGFYGPRPFY